MCYSYPRYSSLSSFSSSSSSFSVRYFSSRYSSFSSFSSSSPSSSSSTSSYSSTVNNIPGKKHFSSHTQVSLLLLRPPLILPDISLTFSISSLPHRLSTRSRSGLLWALSSCCLLLGGQRLAVSCVPVYFCSVPSSCLSLLLLKRITLRKRHPLVVRWGRTGDVGQVRCGAAR